MAQCKRMKYPTIEDAIGHTPLVALQRIGAAAATAQRGNVVLGKLEGNNPAGSVKDRPAVSMIQRAEERGDIQPRRHADRSHLGQHRHRAGHGRGHQGLPHGADHAGGPVDRTRADHEGLSVPSSSSRPRAVAWSTRATWLTRWQAEGKGRVLDQFANADNPRIHYETTGPELWEQTGGRITHFVSAMGTTGTITGVSRFLKEKNPAVRIVGAQPSEGSRIPGIRKWPQEYLPKIYDPSGVDELVYVSQGDAEDMCRRLAREEGIFGGISAAGACWVAQQIAAQVENATIAFIVCDRGDRYLSTGVFPA